MTHRLDLLLLALALLFGLPYYWLLVHNPARSIAPQPVHIADLRRLAASVPGPAPQAITATVVAWDRTPGNLLAAGSGLKRRLYTVMSFRLEVPGRGPVVIDTGTTAALAQAARTEAFNAHRQRLVEADLRAASLIVPTAEAGESLGGLLTLGGRPDGPGALARARLNPHQAPPAATPTVVPGRPQAVAPGVVVIPAMAPTPGSQMVYVRLAGGREYLFAGPVAPYGVNVAELRTRSRLLDWLDGRQDRAGAMGWLVTLRQWHREAPGLFVVPAHDVMALIDKDNPSGIVIRE